MIETKAVFRNGWLRPLTQLPFVENQTVTVHIAEIDAISEASPNHPLTTSQLECSDGQAIFHSPVGHPIPGRGIGKLCILAEDDEHLAAFAEYMP